MSEKKFYTCSACGEVRDERYNLNYLDEAKICNACLDEKRYGQKRRECAERGFHVTHTSQGNFITGEVDGVMKFESIPTCACGRGVRFVMDARATPMLESDGRQMKIFGIPMTGFTMPDAPKRWFILEGKPTALPDEIIADQLTVEA